MPGAVSVCEGGWPSLDGKGRQLGPGQRPDLDAAVPGALAGDHRQRRVVQHAQMRSPNMACDRPVIIEDTELAAIDGEIPGPERVGTIPNRCQPMPRPAKDLPRALHRPR